MTKPKIISLFTGAGGLDYGFEAAGFQTSVALEVDAKCCATLRANKAWPIMERDVTTVATSELLGIGNLAVGEADVLIGGPPCQPFSKSGFWKTGEAKRLADPRAATIESYMRMVAEAQPKAFLLENVEGLGFRGKDEGLKLIQSRLAAINELCGTNYRASIAVLNAADFGVPQQRRRMIVIASREGAEFKFPEPTHSAITGDKGLKPYVSAWEAIHDVPPTADPRLKLTGKWADLLPTIPEGYNYLWHTQRGGGEPLFGWRTRYWSFMLKLAKSQPSWTIQAQPGPATGPFHWDNRRLSMREMARLQTFPDDIIIESSISDTQRQLGNAVPSLLAEVLASEISVQFLGRARLNDGRVLGLKRTAVPIPPPATVLALPNKFHAMRGDHFAHPGAGRGRGALSRLGLVSAE